MKLLFYNLKINIWISSDSTQSSMDSQSTTLNFLNCLFFDKMLLIFSYFSPKIFFNLSCPPNCLFSKYFCSFPSKAWLLLVPGHLPSSFCSISSFHHLMLLALLAFECTTRFSFLGHPLTSFFFMVFFPVLHSQRCSCPARMGCLTPNVPGLLQGSSSHRLCTDTRS